ncbi:OLC1v1017337C1 [Oldenlandia corymbosa var. corymbosa]|uniref:OLC1v1017337C1 n=1 Tax=Oldenlandia corymbosa var. corymbosa TaxID=529605 RepID=A0AAV1E970_OLDCO|nr:OLC1v1017337C1 [Oldenlandia corymbosa var. corymbosa]
MTKKNQGSGRGSTAQSMNNGDQRLDFKSIMKDMEHIGYSHMTWKQKKELENKKVVSLGGKPPKSQRLPLSVARVVMKKQQEREAKRQQENLILGRFTGSHGRDSKKTDKRKPEERVLKSTTGVFKNGVLNVKNMFKPSTSKPIDEGCPPVFDKKKKKKGGKKKGGKKGGKNGRRR